MRKSFQLEDIPYLFHRLQSLLPVKDSARLCILSKSWLEAWSTIPTLRFLDTIWLSQEQERNYNNVINRTLERYYKDNIEIESIDLTINIKNQELAFLAEKWVQILTSKTSLKELYLTIRDWDLLFLLTSEIFSSRNLITVSVKHIITINPLWISDNPNHVNCVSLRVLELHRVRITEGLLHKLLSTCTLLEKISLFCCEGIKIIKINNLRHLREVKFEAGGQNDVFEINDVPSLKLFSYDSAFLIRKKPPPFSICSLGSITELCLDGVVIDTSLFQIIGSELPFLESLTLDMRYSQPGNMDITSVSLKRMTLKSVKARLVYIQVNAPQLLYFCYIGCNNIASLLFTTIAPENITIMLTFTKMVEHSFFHNMSEVLNLSSKFHFKLDFSGHGDVVRDIDGLRRNISFPAKNIQHLSLDLKALNDPWLKRIFFDVFFSVCHPNYVSLCVNKNKYPFNLIARKVLKYWRDYPKDVDIKNPLNGEWEPLTTAWITIHDKLLLADSYTVDFKLNW